MFKRTLCLGLCLALCACQSPPAEPLDEAAVALDVENRLADPELVSAALELIDRPAYSPAIDASRLTDADAADFWQASALVYSSGLRAARRDLEAALARESSAGLPRPIGLSGRTLELADFERDSEVSASIDLLGLLGLGPAAAASALADAATRRAAAAVEEAAWRLRFDVDLARVACAAQAGLLTDLRAHHQAVQSTLRRFDVLDRLGRLPPAASARARTHAHLLAQEIARSEVEMAERRAALARIVGIPATHPLLAALGSRSLDDIDRSYPATAPPSNEELLRRHPQLRRLRFDYALAEASLRRAVAEAWPTLRIGPRGKITPDDFITGGLIDLTLPWPGSTSGEIEAALALRARAREQIEEALIDIIARGSAARTTVTIATRSLGAEAEPARTQAAVTWRGLQARFAIDESRWDLWTDALTLETTALREYWRARETLARARVNVAREQALMETSE